MDCSCGYRMQATTLGRHLAAGAALHHLRKQIAIAKTNGQSVEGWVEWVRMRDVPEDVQRLKPLPWVSDDGAVLEVVQDVTTPLLGRT
jgi:hypothetical protein